MGMLSSLISPQQVAKAAPVVEGAAEGNIEKKPSSVGQIIGGISSVASKAAPFLKMIPGFGNTIGGVADIVGKIGSSLSANDPEWYARYTAAGVSMNELLICRNVENFTRFETGEPYEKNFRHDGTQLQLIPAVELVGVARPDQYDKLANRTKDELLPTILAEVRKATNNVLQDHVDDYWTTFCNFIHLYEIYYSGMKLIKLSEDYPLNIPDLSELFTVLGPANISTFKGAIESLKHYLESTVKLPHALVEYIRWRFGTMFLSDNTERAGLVSYSPVGLYAFNKRDDDIAAGLGNIKEYDEIDTIGGTITDMYKDGVAPSLELQRPIVWYETIRTIKTRIASLNRAPADMKLAYDDHGVRYDVNPRSWDAKEANLRSNMAFLGQRQAGAGSIAKNVQVVLDSHLEMSAGIQSVTLSTNVDGDVENDIALFPLTAGPMADLYDTKLPQHQDEGDICIRQPYGEAVEQYVGARTTLTDSRSSFYLTIGSGALVFAYAPTTVTNVFQAISISVDASDNGATDLTCDLMEAGWHAFPIHHFIAYSGAKTSADVSLEAFAKTSNDFLYFGCLHSRRKLSEIKRLGLDSLRSNPGQGIGSLSIAGPATIVLADGGQAMGMENPETVTSSTNETMKMQPNGHVRLYDLGYYNVVLREVTRDFAKQMESFNCGSNFAINQASLLLGSVLPDETMSFVAAPLDGVSGLELMLAANKYFRNNKWHGESPDSYVYGYSFVCPTYFMTGAQSYNYATITKEQLTAIHRTAYRNLIRGDYKQTSDVRTRDEVKEPAKEIVEAVVETAKK